MALLCYVYENTKGHPWRSWLNVRKYAGTSGLPSDHHKGSSSRAWGFPRGSLCYHRVSQRVPRNDVILKPLSKSFNHGVSLGILTMSLKELPKGSPRGSSKGQAEGPQVKPQVMLRIHCGNLDTASGTPRCDKETRWGTLGRGKDEAMEGLR